MVIAGLSALALVACTASDDDRRRSTPSTSPTPTATFTDYVGFTVEYENSVNKLARSLPQDVTFPETPPGDWESDGNFEAGTGEVAAALYWRCAWASSYVSAADVGNSADAAVALDKLAGWGELPEVQSHTDDETRAKWIERVVKPAQAGDDALLRAIQSGCQ